MTANLPSFIYGTAWKEDYTSTLVEQALEAGFTGIDTANQRKHYFEEAVGLGLEKAYAKKIVSREKLFLQSKYTYPNGQDSRKPYDEDTDFATQVQQSFDSTLEHLKTDYLDSYILHGPYSAVGLTDEDRQVWQAMETIFQQKKVRFLGVSNISLNQLIELIDYAGIKPSFVQNRCFAHTEWDKEIRELCIDHKIIYQGFSLLTANQSELQNPKIDQISNDTGKTKAQVIFRFAQQMKMIPLTGTTDLLHMKDDLAVTDFELTQNQLQTIQVIARPS
ncbi:MAG: xylose reductase [Coxiella sp. (in: Bacteria)]|nr:MAG: xylose reductase [Coxiella sp. (in: g-proteobacteria)]